MLRLRALLLLVAAGLVGACALMLTGRVSSFHVLDATPRSFVLVPITDQQESLEFRTYAGMVRDQLIARGWKEAPLASADAAVFLQYQISQGRQVAFSYPIFGQVPTGSSTTTGSVSTYGNTASFNATTTQQTTVGVVGTGTGSRTEFDRAVRLTMFSVPAYRESGRMERLYEGEIRSTGSTGDLPAVMPALIRGLLEEFPGTSGSSRSVTLSIQK